MEGGNKQDVPLYLVRVSFFSHTYDPIDLLCGANTFGNTCIAIGHVHMWAFLEPVKKLEKYTEKNILYGFS